MKKEELVNKIKWVGTIGVTALVGLSAASGILYGVAQIGNYYEQKRYKKEYIQLPSNLKREVDENYDSYPDYCRSFRKYYNLIQIAREKGVSTLIHGEDYDILPISSLSRAIRLIVIPRDKKSVLEFYDYAPYGSLNQVGINGNVKDYSKMSLPQQDKYQLMYSKIIRTTLKDLEGKIK